MTALIPQNDLENALLQVVADPAAAPQFYRALLAAELYTIDHGDDAAKYGAEDLEEGTTIMIPTMLVEDEPHAVFFSSAQQLEEAVPAGTKYVAVVARDLFEVLRGSPAIMNPASEYGKQFTAEEIDAMLDGTLLP